MRKILTSVLTIGIIAVLMAVGTFAYFNDTESAGFTIHAGVIDLEVDGENPWCESFDFEVKPQRMWEKDFILHMTGESNPAKAWFGITGVTDDGGILTEPERWEEGLSYDCTNEEWTGTHNPVDTLSEYIYVDIAINESESSDLCYWRKPNPSGNYKWMDTAAPEPVEDYLPSLAELNSDWIQLTTDCDCTPPTKLMPCIDYTFHLSFHNILNGEDNEYQGDTTSFTVQFYVTQTDGDAPT